MPSDLNDLRLKGICFTYANLHCLINFVKDGFFNLNVLWSFPSHGTLAIIDECYIFSY